MMLANPWFNSSKFNCAVCIKQFSDPMIGTNGAICCGKCVDQAIKKYPGIKWHKCRLFDNLYMLAQIRVDINLYRIVEDPNFVCNDEEETLQVLDMIDTENTNRINSNPTMINDVDILVKIFSNHKLINQIARVLVTEYEQTQKMWQGEQGWTIIHYVCRFGTIDLIRRLITNYKFDLNICNMQGIYPIHIISSKSNLLKSSDQVVAIKMFIDKKIDLNVKNDHGIYPIHLLSGLENNLDSHDQHVILTLLIEQKVKFDVGGDKRYTPLNFLTTGMFKMNIVQKNDLITRIINSPDYFNEAISLLQLIHGGKIFSSSDQYKLLDLIFKNNPQIMYVKNSHGQYPVHCFINETSNLTSSVQLDIIESMIQHKIDLNIEDNNGMTPIHLICSDMNRLTSTDQLRAIQLIIDNEYADFNKIGINGFSPIHYIVSDNNNLTSTDQCSAIMKLIRSRRIDFNVCDKFGRKPIHYVTSNLNHLTGRGDQLCIIKRITAETIDMNSPDIDGVRPIHNITSKCNNMDSNNQLNAIKFMVSHGVELNVVDLEGVSPIHNILSDNNSLISQHQLDCLTLLCCQKKNKINMEIMDSNGWRPIHFITSGKNNLSSCDQLKALRLLINLNVDVNANTLSGLRPIHFIANQPKNQNNNDDNQFKQFLTLINNGADIKEKITATDQKFITLNEGLTLRQLVMKNNNKMFRSKAAKILK